MNPYRNLPASNFWRRSVAGGSVETDLVLTPKFRISPQQKVATAGSCFAQHIARALQASGYNYFVAETGDADAGYGVFSARYANIYTARQMLQLFERAYGLFDPVDKAWHTKDGFIDPFRPTVETFSSRNALDADRSHHLAAVRRVFEDCDVFVFTLGLTEAWRSPVDGAMFPVHPGVVGCDADAEFVNFRAQDVINDMTAFFDHLWAVNDRARAVITVSPVPLNASYEARHVLVSNAYSKAALRVAAEELTAADPRIAYFPSYEIITGQHTLYRHYDADMRSILPTGVDIAMAQFKAHYLSDSVDFPRVPQPPAAEDKEAFARARAAQTRTGAVVCEEDLLDPQ